MSGWVPSLSRRSEAVEITSEHHRIGSATDEEMGTSGIHVLDVIRFLERLSLIESVPLPLIYNTSLMLPLAPHSFEFSLSPYLALLRVPITLLNPITQNVLHKSHLTLLHRHRLVTRNKSVSSSISPSYHS